MTDNKTKTIDTPETFEPEAVKQPEAIEKEDEVRVEPLYFYPKQGITVKAKTREEADKLLEQKLKDNKESNNG